MLDEELPRVVSWKIFTWIVRISFHFQIWDWIHGAWIPMGFLPLDPPGRRLLFGHFSSLMSSGCCWLQLNVFEPSNWSFLVQKKTHSKTHRAFQITYLHTIWHPVFTIYTIRGTITYPIPIGTFESMIFPTSRLGGICDVSSLEGNPSTWSSWRKRSLEAFF